MTFCTRQHTSTWISDFVTADILVTVTSPRKLFIDIITNNIYGMQVSKKRFIDFESKFTDLDIPEFVFHWCFLAIAS